MSEIPDSLADECRYTTSTSDYCHAHGGYLIDSLSGRCDRRWTPDSLAGEDGAVVLNPSAIGNPNEQPQVWVGADLRALLNPCECGGVNGYHYDDCDATVQPSQRVRGAE